MTTQDIVVVVDGNIDSYRHNIRPLQSHHHNFQRSPNDHAYVRNVVGGQVMTATMAMMMVTTRTPELMKTADTKAEQLVVTTDRLFDDHHMVPGWSV